MNNVAALRSLEKTHTNAEFTRAELRTPPASVLRNTDEREARSANRGSGPMLGPVSVFRWSAVIDAPISIALDRSWPMADY